MGELGPGSTSALRESSTVQVVRGLAEIIQRRGSAAYPIDLAADERTEQAPPRCGCAKGHYLLDP
jgi:ferredoxin-thioredoxin reductase catalytic subunit